MRVQSGTVVPCGGMCAYHSVFNAKLSEAGQVISEFPLSGAFVDAMLVDCEGRILVANDGPVLRGVLFDGQLTRLMVNGALDPSFQPFPILGGSVASVLFAGYGRALAVQPSGKIVLMGSFASVDTSVAGVPRLNLARLEPDGQLDASFNPILQMSGSIASVVVLNSGTIVLGGAFSQINQVRCANLALLFPRELMNAAVQNGRFTARIGTVQGRSYTLESSPSLTLPQWTAKASTAGDGSIKMLSDTNPLSDQSFYRIRVE